MFNFKTAIVVAPHADDETLGCGGTILKLIEAGVKVHWLLITNVSEEYGYSKEFSERREAEIIQVYERYKFEKLHNLGLKPASLDLLPKGDLIAKVSAIITEVRPDLIFVPYRNDAHSDHEIVYDAVMASAKSFRYPYIKKILAYETLSETDFGFKPEDRGFAPNVFVDIEKYLENKLSILEIFESEIGEFPFPRSRKAIKSLGYIRGIQSNKEAAESFMLLKEIL